MRVSFKSGLWPTKDQNGLHDLADRMHELCSTGTYDFYNYDEPIKGKYDISVRHSFGANEDPGELEYLVYIEPVRFWWSQRKWVVPPTVKRADCFIRWGLRFPPSVTIQNTSLSNTNWVIPGLDHGNAPRRPEIQEIILGRIKSML